MAYHGAHVDDRTKNSDATLPMINRLKELRAERNWSQADLASQLDVSRQTINAVENGRYDPSLPLAFQIARIFALPIEVIFNDEQ
ncbi:transcriptional regulator [Pseudomonas asuensis]|uniref:Transcriptional regulator n=2 Tax=Pseudomonas asuensis TaxID=1825787 RepID=A0ABQ2GZE9_9PSED|nr:transcriptional regulator [Pseudomonas asuensis]